jgi:putative transposase
MSEIAWPHAPTHQLSQAGTYFVTCGTYNKQHYFCGRQRCSVLHRGLIKILQEAGWRPEAWAVFSNHYHFVAHCPSIETAKDLPALLRRFHAKLGTWVNKLDGVHDRKVWYNFWDTRLTFQQSFLARLNYVHQNAVHHGLVEVANQYPWCSASWFERVASPAKVKSIYRFKSDRLTTPDEFEPSADW